MMADPLPGTKRLAVFALMPGIALLGSMDFRWHRVASKHAAFARSLAAEQVRFDRAFIKWVEQFIGGCHVKSAKLRGLDAAKEKQVKLFADEYCKPWLLAWVDALDPCERNNPPPWCTDDEAARRRLDPAAYFARLTLALGESRDPLERYNIVAAMMDATSNDDVARFPPEVVELWLEEGVRQYLMIAPPDDAIDIAQWIAETWFGLRPSLAAMFARYAREHEGLSSLQRARLLA